MNAQSTTCPHRPLRLLRRPLAAALALLLAPAAFAQNLPDGFTLKSGSVDLPSTVGQTMTIGQHSKGAIIEWNGFNIANGYHVDFQQPGVDSVTLNRVTGAGMSQIDGLLTANGRVFVVNTAGVLFGSNAQVNVGGLVASTLAISDDAFNSGVASGKYVFGSVDVTVPASVENDGSISAAMLGTVALLGGRVDNYGRISAPQGTIALAAGSTITVDIGGDGLTQLTLNVGADNGNGVHVSNHAGASLLADGGRIALQASGLSAQTPFSVVSNSGIVQARSLQSRNGQIVLSSVSANNSDSVDLTDGLLDASGTTAGVSGGSIAITGYNVGLQTKALGARLDASGANGGGTVAVTARNVLMMDGSSSVNADAGAGGNGGAIRLFGANGLYAFGNLSARGGNGGNGGTIETSGGGLALGGLRVNANAPGGSAGKWTIDPYDISIVHGSANGSLPATPYTALTNATLQDGDINAALDSGTSVAISTGDPAAGSASGNIQFNAGVQIARTLGSAPLDLRFDAHGRISGNSFAIQSANGPMSMEFDSDADNLFGGSSGGINFDAVQLHSNGGSISMFGQGNAVANGNAFGIVLQGDGSVIDTRVGSSDTAAAGNLLLRGSGQTVTGLGSSGVSLSGGFVPGGLIVQTGTGNIDIVGHGNGGGDGITLATPNIGPLQLLTSSGHINLTGFGSTLGGSYSGGNGISALTGFSNTPLLTLRSVTGQIDLRGYGVANSTSAVTGLQLLSDGILLGPGTQVLSSSGNILLTGSSLGSGVGIGMPAGSANNPGTSLIDAGSGNITLRAHNNPAALVDSLQLGGNLHTTSVADIRGGSVDANGNLVENPGDLIAINPSTPLAGISLFSPELANISAGTLVLGSDIQSGDVYVDSTSGNVGYAGNLTLQAGGGGAVHLDGSGLNVGANKLALIAGGNVSQVGAITAGSLLATSQNGAVQLANPLNQVSANTVAGTAAGNFTFINAGDVGIGTVNTLGFAAGANTPTALAASGISAGGNVLVQSLGGNLLLNANVSGNAVNLVADAPTGLFLNNAGASITAASYWHVWASTWVGENRGGLAGNGTLPNLYGCAFSASCTVTPLNTANQFIYIAQPVATIAIDNLSREYGLVNPVLTYVTSGLILGDQAVNAISGSPATTATQASNVGSYAVNGNFTSPAGYLLKITNGALAITPATLTYDANPFARTYGDPNGALAGTVSGFRLTDTQASATTGTLVFNTSATQASGVGSYAINGSGLTASNYVFAQNAGNATAFVITPATLTYVANPQRRMAGTPNGTLGGNVNGFRNGDTVGTATTGTLAFQTPAGIDSPVGVYGIFGTGLNANNYVFVQANGNAQALTITPPLQAYTLDIQRDTPVTYVYDRNFGMVGLCPATDLASGSRDKDGDTLAREWSRVRSRPNLANCVSTKQKNSCGDF